VQQQVLGRAWARAHAPVRTVQYQCCCHPAAVVAAGHITTGLTAHCNVLQVQHQHLLLLRLWLRWILGLLCLLLAML
jgi:hypothetical protein